MCHHIDILRVLTPTKFRSKCCPSESHSQSIRDFLFYFPLPEWPCTGVDINQNILMQSLEWRSERKSYRISSDAVLKKNSFLVPSSFLCPPWLFFFFILSLNSAFFHPLIHRLCCPLLHHSPPSAPVEVHCSAG